MRKIYSISSQTTQPVFIWLVFISLMVVAMVLIGGITRLTDSGLSMVEWRPLLGILPPLSDMEWQRVFDLYRQSPEYQQINEGMSLTEFKAIFFWEWFHRFWGRLIGLAFALPAIWFLIRGYIPAHDRLRIFMLFCLGGLQGLIGWWMVKSGLVNEPDVAPVRLMVHLLAALLILGSLIWAALSYREKCFYGGDRQGQIWQPFLCLILVTVTIASGAIVAGLKGGLIYNEFPMMGDGMIPEDYWQIGWADSFWGNALHSHAASQFHHRLLAMISAIIIIYMSIRHIRRPRLGMRQKFWAGCVFAMILVQVILGISVLILQVPVSLAVIHQGGAILLFSLITIWLFYSHHNL